MNYTLCLHCGNYYSNEMQRISIHARNAQFMTSCPLSKALITLCRGEISERR